MQNLFRYLKVGSLALVAAAQSHASPAWQPLAPPSPSVACFEAEGFRSYEEWSEQIRKWRSESPPLPNPLSAAKGMQVFKNERTFAGAQFKSDKQQHCYIGCRIAQESDFQTAQFAAWEKERRDLLDCNPTSHFEFSRAVSRWLRPHRSGTRAPFHRAPE